MLISGWQRRKFEGVIKYIPPFHTNLKLAKFRFTDRNTDINRYKMDGSSTENANLQEEITNEIAHKFIKSGNIVILIGLVPKLAYDSVVLFDYGSGNSRRLIPITKIHHEL